MERESLELLLRNGLSVERIAKRFGKDPSTISYWMRKHGLKSPNREKHAARGGLEREVLEALVEQGKTAAEIAAVVDRSLSTVRHWLVRYGLRTQHARGQRPRKEATSAREAGRRTVAMVCRHHGETNFIIEPSGYYRCKRCRSERVAARRRKVKSILAGEAGGCCAICGYDHYLGALEFHHLDPGTKRLGLSSKGAALAIATLRSEAQKCILLCSNCHAEVEGGVADLPITSAEGTPLISTEEDADILQSGVTQSAE
ncbi:MAG: helix-turn-helix domain-containing protein [Actinomycetota bacterium]|nr:helix-turn-helix domain-containing protein [Actinomycetota bacterium]